jgi:DNA excision repair protein ERCC-2
MRISGGKPDDYVMVCESPFDEKNLKVIAACNIELTYKKRNDNISKIISYINAVIEHKKGNYMAFFPSIEFMNLVYDAYVKQYGEENLILQKAGMSEEDRAEFISRFDNDENALCAFAVLGGSFAESIDLTGEKLIGCIVVSVGLPKVCYEREKLKQYYDKEGSGFDYAYLYEGMNKIMQAGEE